MPTPRITTVALCLATLGLSSLAQANQQEDHQVAVTFVAMEQVCNQAIPGLNGTVESALANEKIDEPLKAQILKVKAEPQYKPEVDGMVRNLAGTPLGQAAVEKGMCKSYAAK